MFYDKFVELCKARGMSPAAVARDIGLSNSSTTTWKHGAIPKGKTLQKVAEYFGVSVDYLLVDTWGIKAGGKIKAGGGIKSRYGIEAGGGIETGGPVEVGPRVFDSSIQVNIPQEKQHKDDFEEGLKKVSDAARSALEPPKITETKEQLLTILEELSDEDLETLIKFAQFVKYQQQEAQDPAQPPAEAPPAPAGCTDTPAAQDAPEGAEKAE